MPDPANCVCALFVMIYHQWNRWRGKPQFTGEYSDSHGGPEIRTRSRPAFSIALKRGAVVHLAQHLLEALHI
jgi:hypothetical protein